MKVYTTDSIRNVAVIGHGGSGKTSLVEAMAYLSKTTPKLGSIVAKNTISDFSNEEKERQISIKTSLIPIEWNNCKINFLDTPGYNDFQGEVEEALSVCDGAIIVVNGKSGIEAGTKRAWEMCEKRKIPRIVYVTNMDIDTASFKNVVEDMREMYGKRLAPLHFAIRENEKYVGYVNIISRKGYRWDGPNVNECGIPEYNLDYLEKYRTVLVETVAESSEEMLDRYLNGEEFSEDEIRSSLKRHVHDTNIIPMSMGSSTLGQGMFVLLDDVIKYLPSPEKKEVVGINKLTNEIYKADNDFSKPKTMFAFKTMNDPYIGKYTFVKVNSGVIKANDVLYNVNRETEEKIGKIYTLLGNKPIELPELHAGDIGVIPKLSYTKTFDTIATKNTPIVFNSPEISKPYTYKAYIADKNVDIDKLSMSIAKLCEEDPTLKNENDTANHQMLIYGMGDVHLDVVKSILANEYKVPIELVDARISFKETIMKNSDDEYKYKKQSGGHGQYGHVKMRFAANGDYTTPYVFETEVVGGTVPKNYFPAVEKGIKECCIAGPLAGYPVVGVTATLYDGSYHEVDSSEMAFKIATIGCFKEGFMKAKPILLEPIVTLTVTVEEKDTGNIIGDLNKRRGRVLGMTAVKGGFSQVASEVPLSEIMNYSSYLSSATGGMGVFEYTFARYEKAPDEVEQKEIAKYLQNALKDQS